MDFVPERVAVRVDELLDVTAQRSIERQHESANGCGIAVDPPLCGDAGDDFSDAVGRRRGLAAARAATNKGRAVRVAENDRELFWIRADGVSY